MLSADGSYAIGDIKWTQRWLGSQGWNTGGATSRDGLWHKIWFDVSPFFVRRLSIDDKYVPLLDPAKVPAQIVNQEGLPGQTNGGWWGGFGGADATVSYIINQNGLAVSSNFTTTRTYTASAFFGTTQTVDPNQQTNSRTYGKKGATDPINAAVCYFNFAQYGFYRTLNTGGAVAELDWLPRPASSTNGWDPGCRWGIIAVDEAGATTGGANNRKARIAFCPSGQGVFLSTNGGDSGSKITTASGAGKFDSVSEMTWIGNKLICVVVSKDSMLYDQTVSAATGGVGTASTLGKVDNVRVYDAAAGTWSFLAHGMENYQPLNFPLYVTEDPNYPGVGYFIWTGATEVAHTINGTTFIYTGFGNGSAASNGVITHAMARMAPTDRPAMAARFRYGSNNYALSTPVIVKNPTTGLTDAVIVAHTGLGPAKTRLADWPTQNLVYGDNPLLAAKAPLWAEITAGAEAKVGQVPLWLGDRLWNGAQDISVSLAEDGSRGHLAAVYTYPPTGGLSDAEDMARGPISNFGVVYRQRLGGGAVQGVSYTVDNIKWQLAPNQSVAGLAAYEPGSIAAGAGYSAVILPGWSHNSFSGHVPVAWSDIRSSVPAAITFKKEDGTVVPMGFNQDPADLTHPMSFNGFHASYFSAPSKKVLNDPDNPYIFYFWNVGGSTNVDRQDTNGPTTWVTDPADVGGIYKMDIRVTPFVATRVYSAKTATGYGSPNHMGNFGSFDTAFLMAGGYIVCVSNYLTAGASAAAGNRIVVLNTNTNPWTRTVISSGPGNLSSVCLGDPISGTMPVMWAIGHGSDGTYGVFYSTNWWTGATPTWRGPYNVVMPTGGYGARMDAHLALAGETKRFGLLGVSCRTRGLAFGRFESG